MLDFATNLDSGLSVTDSQSGFRAFAGGVRDVFSFRQDGLAIESEMLADAAQAGLRVQEVEIGVRYDVKGSKEHPVSHGVRVLVKVLHDIELAPAALLLHCAGDCYCGGRNIDGARIFFYRAMSGQALSIVGDGAETRDWTISKNAC